MSSTALVKVGGGALVVNRGRQPLTPANGRCGRCEGPLEPSTDGNGNNVNTCQKCGQRHQLKIKGSAEKSPRAVRRSPTTATRKAPRVVAAIARVSRECGVKGCPGELDASGECPCCELRREFAEDNASELTCELCKGEFQVPLDSPDYYSDYCAACRPVAARAAQQEADEE